MKAYNWTLINLDMKTLIVVILLAVVILVSCDPEMVGPVGYGVFRDEFRWKLETYTVKGKTLPTELAGSNVFMKTEDRSNLNTFIFQFFNKDLTPTQTWEFDSDRFDTDKFRKVGTYVMKTPEGKFFFASVRTVPDVGKILSLEISNLMDKEYSPKNDTVRYYYLPVEGF